MSGADRIRIDKWLWHARFLKSRTHAGKFCQAGKVRVHEQLITKAHRHAGLGGENQGHRHTARPGPRSARALRRPQPAPSRQSGPTLRPCQNRRTRRRRGPPDQGRSACHRQTARTRLAPTSSTREEQIHTIIVRNTFVLLPNLPLPLPSKLHLKAIGI